MSAKHRKRHRSPHPQGENPLHRSPPTVLQLLRRRLLLLAVLGAMAGTGWLLIGLWRPAAKPSPAQPAPQPVAEAESVPGSPSAPADKHGATKDQAYVAQVNRGNELLAQGKADEAVEVFREALRQSPEDEDVHYDLALALSRQGKTEEAILQYEEALRILPDYVEAHNNLGNLLLRAGRMEEAITHFERAIKIMPDYASAHNNLGTALQRSGRTSDALEHFQQAVKFNPDYWQAHFNVATSCLQQGRLSEARTELEAVLRLQPDFQPAKAALAEVNRQQAGGTVGQP